MIGIWHSVVDSSNRGFSKHQKLALLNELGPITSDIVVNSVSP